MTKQLTEEKVVRRPQKSADDPTAQQRRKHQITYLAHQVGRAGRGGPWWQHGAAMAVGGMLRLGI